MGRFILGLLQWIQQAWEPISKWASKRRVRLSPFNFTKIPPDSPHATDSQPNLLKISKFSDYPRYEVESEFYDIIAAQPQIAHIISRYFVGYFRAEAEGIEVPDADVMLMWPIVHHRTGPLPQDTHSRCHIFFVDGEYYAGDVIYDKRPEWVLKRRVSVDQSFHVRLLFKVHESC